jgi:hypothetical protein
MPIEDPAQAQKSGVLAKRIAVAAAVLVFLNVFAGLGVIAWKNKKGPNPAARETEMREQLAASLGAAAQNAMPPPSFTEDEIRITVPRDQWEHVANRVLAAGTAFGGSAVKGLPEENLLVVVADIPTIRNAEFRRVLTSAAAITPMPSVGPGQTGGPIDPGEAKERTIVQIRISEAAQ